MSNIFFPETPETPIIGCDSGNKLLKTPNCITLAGIGKKLCVQICSKSCRHYSNCRYQLMLAHMRIGDAKLQVYSAQQYRSAMECNKLPKSRMVVCSPEGRRLIAKDGVHVVTEIELKKLFSWCEKDTSKLLCHRKLVYKQTTSMRTRADAIFAMATSGVNENSVKRHLSAIIDGLKAIRVECIKQLKKPERSDLLKSLEYTIEKCSLMLTKDLDVTHKNQGKRALVAA